MKILKVLRINHCLSQIELAKKLNINQSTLSQYETGYFPSFKIIKKISSIFNVSLDYLINENNCAYPRDLNYLNKMLQLDKDNEKEIKIIIEKNIKNLIQNKNSKDIKILRDSINEEFNDNFHLNLKQLRMSNNMTQKTLAKLLNTGESLIGMYEIKSFPSINKMIKLSELFNCSIHALITGEKLSFKFIDKDFGQSILIADHLLSLEDKNFLIKLMTNLIKNK